ncbi:MAG: DUF4325 domain-containing protein [Treponema sp.]|nr:DUF4325 domain-containing protein [Treponema sp.]
MNVDIGKFGDVLVSRPAGREAFLMAKAYIFNSLDKDDTISLDFANVKVLTPSWIDEFINGIKDTYSNRLDYLNTQNESVTASLQASLAV